MFRYKKEQFFKYLSSHMYLTRQGWIQPERDRYLKGDGQRAARVWVQILRQENKGQYEIKFKFLTRGVSPEYQLANKPSDGLLKKLIRGEQWVLAEVRKKEVRKKRDGDTSYLFEIFEINYESHFELIETGIMKCKLHGMEGEYEITKYKEGDKISDWKIFIKANDEIGCLKF